MTEAEITRAFSFLEKYRAKTEKISKSSMAWRIGVSPQTYRNYEMYKSKPSLEQVEKMSEALKFPLQDTLREQAL